MLNPDEYNNLLRTMLDECKLNNSKLLQELEDSTKKFQSETDKMEIATESTTKKRLREEELENEQEILVIPKDYILYWALGATITALLELIIIIIQIKFKKSPNKNENEKNIYYEIPDATQNVNQLESDSNCDNFETVIRHNYKAKSVNEKRSPKKRSVAKNTTRSFGESCQNNVEYVTMNMNSKPKANTWHVLDDNFRVQNLCPAMAKKIRDMDRIEEDEN